VSDVYGYDTAGFGEVASYSASAGSSLLLSENYGLRDPLGRIQNKTETVLGATHTFVYGYDTRNRLMDVTKDGVNTHYDYDPNGNRTKQNGQTIATYDNQDRLLTFKTFSYTYTANGELRTKTDSATGQTTTYTYDALGNLTHVDLPGAVTIDYVVDGNGRRVGKKINGVLVKQWLYRDGLHIVAELDGSGNLISQFVQGSRANTPDYMIKGTDTFRLISDHLGSVRLVVKVSDGSVAQRIDYDEFGAATISTGASDFQPFGFAGGLYDPDTKLERFRKRDYDATTSRWTSKDPYHFLAGDANLYAYVGSDPVNWIDPSGDFKLPPDPSGLDPDWTIDPSHRDPNGIRFRHPSGDVLDWHPGRQGQPGWRGKDHWHHNGSDRHYSPGEDVPDPAPICEQSLESAPDPSDEPEPADRMPDPEDLPFPESPMWPMPFPAPFPAPEPFTLPVPI
jgi:RHS repeat-associated protein